MYIFILSFQSLVTQNYCFAWIHTFQFTLCVSYKTLVERYIIFFNFGTVFLLICVSYEKHTQIELSTIWLRAANARSFVLRLQVALFNNGQHANDALNFNDATTETTTSTTTIAHHRHSSSTANIMQVSSFHELGHPINVAERSSIVFALLAEFCIQKPGPCRTVVILFETPLPFG